MPQVIFTPEADEDLRRIGVFITEKANEDLAFAMVLSIVEKCQTLASFPLAGTRRDELLPDLRSFVVDPYVFFYLPLADGIAVLRVLHSAQDADRVFLPDESE